MSSCSLSRDVPRCVATCRAVFGTEEPARVPFRSVSCASVPRDRSPRTRRPQEAHRFQTPSSCPARRAPMLRTFQASISASTSGRHARSERGVAPVEPFQRARSAARSSPRAMICRGTPCSDHSPRSSRSRAPSASPRPRTTAKSTSTCSAKAEVGGRRLIPHLGWSRRPTEGWARLTSRREVEDDGAASPKKFPTRSMACPLARNPVLAPGHKGPESTSTCEAPSSFF